jgi:hypothetical protein
MASSAVRAAKVFLNAAFVNSWVMPVEGTSSVQSQSTTAIDASTVVCRSALLLACAQNVSYGVTYTADFYV